MVGIFSVVYSYVHAFKNPPPVVTNTPVLSLKKKRRNKTKIKNKSIYFVRRNL